MGKLLLLVIVLFAVVAVLRVVASKRSGHSNASADKKKKPQTALEALLPCPHCGVHMIPNELAAHQLSHHHL